MIFHTITLKIYFKEEGQCGYETRLWTFIRTSMWKKTWFRLFVALNGTRGMEYGILPCRRGVCIPSHWEEYPINILGGAVMSHDAQTWRGKTRGTKSDYFLRWQCDWQKRFHGLKPTAWGLDLKRVFRSTHRKTKDAPSRVQNITGILWQSSELVKELCESAPGCPKPCLLSPVSAETLGCQVPSPSCFLWAYSLGNYVPLPRAVGLPRPFLRGSLFLASSEMWIVLF